MKAKYNILIANIDGCDYDWKYFKSIALYCFSWNEFYPFVYDYNRLKKYL